MMDDDTYALDPEECLEYGDDCQGPVEYRWPGVGEKHWPRCVYHGDRRIDNVSELEIAAQSPLAPSWFDEADAGERWDDDY
jgi:hypothetical protein